LHPAAAPAARRAPPLLASVVIKTTVQLVARAPSSAPVQMGSIARGCVFSASSFRRLAACVFLRARAQVCLFDAVLLMSSVVDSSFT
jgi:hypothetical protein